MRRRSQAALASRARGTTANDKDPLRARARDSSLHVILCTAEPLPAIDTRHVTALCTAHCTAASHTNTRTHEHTTRLERRDCRQRMDGWHTAPRGDDEHARVDELGVTHRGAERRRALKQLVNVAQRQRVACTPSARTTNSSIKVGSRWVRRRSLVRTVHTSAHTSETITAAGERDADRPTDRVAKCHKWGGEDGARGGGARATHRRGRGRARTASC